MKNYLIYDTETSGFLSSKLDPKDPKQAWICQFAGKLINEKGDVLMSVNILQQSQGREINKHALAVHNKTTKMCDEGLSELEFYNTILTMFKLTDIAICHNVAFDGKMLENFALRFDDTALIDNIKATTTFCTMKNTTNLLKLPKKRGNGYKWPKLEELYRYLFNEDFDNAHDALADVNATIRCFTHQTVQEIFVSTIYGKYTDKTQVGDI